MNDAIVLLSGGIDSATALAMTRATGRRCHALSFRYGQRHAVELAAAARVAAALGAVSHAIIDLDLRAIGGSALTADIPVPKGRDEAEIGSGIPVTYVPARNTIFLAYAIALAEVRGASEIVVGRQRARLVGLPRLPARVAGGDAGGGAPRHQGGRRAAAGDHPRAAHQDDEGGDHPRRREAGRRLRPHPLLLRPRADRRGVRRL